MHGAEVGDVVDVVGVGPTDGIDIIKKFFFLNIHGTKTTSFSSVIFTI